MLEDKGMNHAMEDGMLCIWLDKKVQWKGLALISLIVSARDM